MTERLYWHDAYLRRWHARVVERREVAGKVALILDRSAFYPTGGGQPHDRGVIGGAPVADVQALDDGVIAHILAQEAPAAAEVVCELDWPRRRDFMQHHSAQHILTRACEKELGAATIGFHLTETSATIDLDGEPDEEGIEKARALANRIVMENRPIRADWRSDEAALAEVRMRGVARRERLRVVEIEDFDATACGGTHARATGELGLIQITRRQARGKATRLTFVCGARALRDYSEKSALLRQLATAATRSMAELPAAFNDQREEIQRLRRQLKRNRATLMEVEARELRQHAIRLSEIPVVWKVYPEDSVVDLSALADQLEAEGGCLALLARAGDAAQLLFVADEKDQQWREAAMKAALAWIPGAELAYRNQRRALSKPFRASAALLRSAMKAALAVISGDSGK